MVGGFGFHCLALDNDWGTEGIVMAVPTLNPKP